MDDQELELLDPMAEVEAVPVDTQQTPMTLEPDVTPLLENEGYSPTPAELGGVAGLRGWATSPNPWSVKTTSNLIDNLTGQQYPVDLRTGLPVRAINEPLAYDEAPALVPGAPIQIKEKTGSDETVSISRTPEAQRAAENMRGAVTESGRIAQEQAENAVVAAKAQAAIELAKATYSKEVAAQAEQIKEISKQELDASLTEMQRIRDELRATPWESYWGSKSTGDKIMLGLAVGLGALGQAQLGGQNIALQVVMSTIEDHNTAQKQRTENLRERLRTEGTLSTQTQQALKLQTDVLDASKVANYDMLNQQLEVLKSKVKTPDAVLKLEQLQQDTRLKQEAEIANLESKYATRTTSARDVFQVRNASDQEQLTKRMDGKDMSESQQKEIGYVLDAGFYAKRMEDLENNAEITTKPAWAQARNAMINEARSFGALGGSVSVAQAAANFGTMLDKYEQGNPQLQDYIRNVRGIMDARLRKVTGATVNMSELVNELQMMLPKGPNMNDPPEHQFADIQSAQKARRHKLETSRALSGSGAKLWYEVPNAGK